jgi:hypothetical protein
MLSVMAGESSSITDGLRVTTVLDRHPTTTPAARRENQALAADAPLLLQFLPSGVCLSLCLKQPMILGRAPASAFNGLLSLAAVGAAQHGVSRKHCRLERRDQSLTVTDLGTTNGTYLNDQRLVPHQPHQVAHGDRLILGTLHIIVFFG